MYNNILFKSNRVDVFHSVNTKLINADRNTTNKSTYISLANWYENNDKEKTIFGITYYVNGAIGVVTFHVRLEFLVFLTWCSL